MWGRTVATAIVLVCLLARPAGAYSVLTHEAIVDAVWDRSIAPLLRRRFHASPAQLKDARAYAYGGCVVQDMGYYPFGSHFFSDLVHYVRSGDFVVALLRDARDADEYAFALGALAHFVSDNTGHPVAINPSVPLIYPKLEAKYGAVVTYEDDPTAHLRTEFAFDVVEVARGGYVSTKYHDFIGFKVSKPVLQRAFKDTYGLDLDDVFGSFDLAVGTFRRTASTLIPAMTKVAWASKHDDIMKVAPDMTADRYVFGMTRGQYEGEWGTTYSRPSFGHKVLSVLLKIVPKIGPFRTLAFKIPTPEAERLFLRSVEATVERYRSLLTSERQHRLSLVNRNFDTGSAVMPGRYRLLDDTYAKLLDSLAKRHFESVSATLRRNILAFYSDASAAADTRRDRKAWAKVQRNLDALTQSGLAPSSGIRSRASRAAPPGR